MTPERDERPRPQYGEYSEPAADASYSEKPTEFSSAVPAATGADVSSDAGAATPPSLPAAPAAPSTPPAGANRLPGVPHNLGVRGDATARQAVSAPKIGEPYRAADPTPRPGNETTETKPSQLQAQAQAQVQAPAQAATPAKPRGADRIITIALLALGGYFALSMAFSLSQFSTEFAKIANDIGVADFTAPPAVRVIGTVGAIIVLSIYALVLIFSIRRLRARKLTFWAPLAAGVLAWMIFFVLFAVALSQSAELWQALMQVASDPEKAQQLLDQLSTRP